MTAYPAPGSDVVRLLRHRSSPMGARIVSALAGAGRPLRWADIAAYVYEPGMAPKNAKHSIISCIRDHRERWAQTGWTITGGRGGYPRPGEVQGYWFSFVGQDRGDADTVDAAEESAADIIRRAEESAAIAHYLAGIPANNTPSRHNRKLTGVRIRTHGRRFS